SHLYVALRPYTDDIPNDSWLARSLPMLIPILDRVYGIRVVMHKRFVQNDNRNGIIIGVPRGTHFPAQAETPEAKQPQPEPNEPKSGTEPGSMGKPFSRKL